ncbi:DUF6053 domain-containing protein [Lysobacter yananisis]
MRAATVPARGADGFAARPRRRCACGGLDAFVGGPSGPMLSAQVAAI